MLNKLKNLIKEAGRQIETFDASGFEDPLALQTDWSPLKGGGSNFRTHNLVSENYNRTAFKASLGAKLFSSVFILVGLGLPSSQIYLAFQNGRAFFDGDFLSMLLFGTVFSIVGAALFYSYAKPVVFDKTNGFFWKGWKAPDIASVENPGSHSTRISNIHALQIISEYVRGDKSSYYSYELNLVLKDGSRLNVIDHGDVYRIRENAGVLSQFLGKPVWDSTRMARSF